MPTPAPSFGKRNAPRRVPPAASGVPAIAPAHAAFFAQLRVESRDDDERPRVVPRSFRAALLAGLVVGFCLAGLDATQADTTLRHVAGLVPGGAPKLLPVVILFGLLGGARAAATNLLVSHWLLRRLGWSGHIAYAAGGGAVAAGVALVVQGLAGSGFVEPSLLHGHGVALDVAAGVGAGFFYRVFAGAARA